MFKKIVILILCILNTIDSHAGETKTGKELAEVRNKSLPVFSMNDDGITLNICSNGSWFKVTISNDSWAGKLINEYCKLHDECSRMLELIVSGPNKEVYQRLTDKFMADIESNHNRTFKSNNTFGEFLKFSKNFMQDKDACVYTFALEIHKHNFRNNTNDTDELKGKFQEKIDELKGLLKTYEKLVQDAETELKRLRSPWQMGPACSIQ